MSAQPADACARYQRPVPEVSRTDQGGAQRAGVASLRFLTESRMLVWAVYEFWFSLLLIPVFFGLELLDLRGVALLLIGVLSCWAITSTAAGRISAARAAKAALEVKAEVAEVDVDVDIR